MSKSDEINRRRAAAYAWRFFAPGDEQPEVPGLEESSGDPPTPDDDDDDVDVDVDDDDDDDDVSEQADPDADEQEYSGSTHWLHEEKFRDCDAVANGVDNAWPITDTAMQAKVVAMLLAWTVPLESDITTMHDHPLQSVRLLRLVARLHGQLSDEALRDAYNACLWFDYGHAEVIDMLIEVARSGDLTLADRIFLTLHQKTRLLSRYADAGARLARLLDQAQTVHERYIALTWLHIAAWPESIEPLRRMLRQRCFIVRFYALRILDMWFPDAITADDLMFLLEDAVTHILPQDASMENYRARYEFSDLLTRAVGRVRPAGGHVPLERILDLDCAYRVWDCGLDETWALCTLAAGYPERAVARIDRLFLHMESERRRRALKAAGSLLDHVADDRADQGANQGADELAWPRLMAAAADGDAEIAERAQAIWLERRGSLCPLDELAGIEVALLDGPPSDQLRSRLAMLRTCQVPVRLAMIEVLLAEAPDPEALVLLLFVVADDALHVYKNRPGLPADRDELSATILSGFGVRGMEGLCALATRYPYGDLGWLHSIAQLMGDEYDIPEAAFPVLRATAARGLAETSAQTSAQISEDIARASRILARVGTPPELFARLWSIARDPAERRPTHDRVADALAAMQASDVDYDGIVSAEMQAALAASDVPRFARAAAVGLRRGLPEAVPMVLRVLEQRAAATQDDLAMTDALELCVDELERLERLPNGWHESALAQVGTHAFAVAARCLPDNPPPEALAVLRAALDAASPMTAAEAAMALVNPEAIHVEVSAITDIAARAPLLLGTRLVYGMSCHGEVPRSLRPLVERILVSTDPRITEYWPRFILGLADNGWVDDILAIGPKFVHQALRFMYGEWLRRQPENHWQDEELGLAGKKKMSADIWAELEKGSRSRARY